MNSHTTDSLRIHKLEAENFKRIEVLSIVFPEGGGSFEFAGQNQAGKSSAIDALSASMFGKAGCPDMPLRNGTAAGQVSVILGEPGAPDALRVVRRWKADGETQLVVTDADGTRVSTPQALLDSLWSKIAFDPLEFERMTSSKQAEVLRQLAGLDFADLRRQYALAEDKRKEAGRELKSLESRAKLLPIVEPAEPVNIRELHRQFQQANDANAARFKSVREHERLVAKQSELGDKVRQLRVELHAAEGLLAETAQMVDAAAALVPPLIETQALMKALDEANDTNEQARKYRERADMLAKLEEVAGAYDEHDAELKAIVVERKRRLEEAHFPVAGLSIDNDAVTLRGIPFDQVSSSERLITSMCIAAALRPKLRVAIIKDGSLLDETNLALVNDWARSNDYQVFIERVANTTAGAGVVIAAGRVKALSAGAAS